MSEHDKVFRGWYRNYNTHKDRNEAYGHEQVSIHLLKIFGKTICKPLKCIFPEYLNNGLFPLKKDKGDIVPIHKKGDKHYLKNYRSISLLPICGNISKTNVQWNIRVFNENNLISPKQSGFKPEDSCINQLTSITMEI